MLHAATRRPALLRRPPAAPAPAGATASGRRPGATTATVAGRTGSGASARSGTGAGTTGTGASGTSARARRRPGGRRSWPLAAPAGTAAGAAPGPRCGGGGGRGAAGARLSKATQKDPLARSPVHTLLYCPRQPCTRWLSACGPPPHLSPPPPHTHTPCRRGDDSKRRHTEEGEVRGGDRRDRDRDRDRDRERDRGDRSDRKRERDLL
jgi:hypothetical protein